MNDRNETTLNQPEPYKAETHEAAPEKKSGHCCLYGCLFSLVFLLMLAVCGGFAGYWFFQGQVAKYTSDKPAEMPVIEYSEEELAAIESRVETFKEAIDKGETPEDLVLTAEELNALISKEDGLRGKVYVTIQEGQVSGEVSIPADFVPGGKGRYFNATATFNVSLDHGVLIVTLADASVKGKRVPQAFIDGMAGENLAKDIYKDPEMAETFRRFDRLTIEDDKIVLKSASPRPEEKARR
ncbi:MAG: hypothetical protein ACC645_12785 [Pirellulales bacterium]